MDDRDNGFEDEEEFQDLIQARATTKPTRWWNSARYTLVFMAFLGFSNVYAMRVNLSVAIVSMVNHTAINSHQPAPNSNDTDVCPIPPGENHTSHLPPDGPFVWDEARQGLVLGSFFYGYVVTQYPGGRLAEHFGAKWIFGIGILITSVFTLLTPIAAQTDFILLIVVRVIEGLGEGVTFPVMLVLLAQWAPPQERSKMTSFAYGGAAFGTILAMPLTGLICDCLGWEAVFYVFGVLGVLWFVAWCFLCYDSPESHPRINEDEKIYILSSLNQDPTGGTGARHRTTLATPWIPLLTSGPFYAILATHVFQSFGYYVLLTELPTYMTNILRYDIKSNALLSAVPYIFAWLVSILSPILADFLIRRETLTKTWTRKAFNTLATVGPALSLIGAAYSGCNYVLTIFLLTLAVATNGAIYSGEQSNMLDMAPNFAGTIMGITNTISNFMGFIAPQLTGLIINHNETLSSWRLVFFLAAGVNILGDLIYVIFGSANEQPWNQPIQ
eukprot:maker-scaffold988_size73003-snap-gene-0.16 protein:Tk02481 transcript:maker-scaffold988_size73003-snap-gene-0.16-mRNA-1 annotation:"hypothetical protein TcasGA2_TC006625"